jgi:hypothetical protein
MAKNLEQAHGAIADYFQFVEKSISASPLGATDRTKAFRSYVERSVAASFELSDKILRAKDLQDALRRVLLCFALVERLWRGRT